jgi:hypothetical protein
MTELNNSSLSGFDLEHFHQEHNTNMERLKKEFQDGILEEGQYLILCIAEINGYRLNIGDF